MHKFTVDNSVFLPQIIRLIEEGHTATIVARGDSMRPFIEDGRDKLVLGKADSVRVGDVVLAELSEGHFVCHRVERISEGMITMRGDGNVEGTECFPEEKLRAKLLQVIRKGVTYTVATSRWWRLYSAVWPRLYSMRRYLLAFYRLVWLHQWPNRWKSKFNKD